MRAQAPIVCPLLPVPASSAPPPTAMAHPVPIAPCRSPFAASRPAPSCAPPPSSTTAATPPQPHPRLVGAGGVVAFGATKVHDFYAKVRNYCVKHADFLPNSPSSYTALHTLPIGIVTLACTPPGTIRTGNLRKTPSSPLFPSSPPAALARSAPFANPLQKTAVSPAISRAKTSEKTARRGFSTGLSRPKRVKNGLKIINRR